MTKKVVNPRQVLKYFLPVEHLEASGARSRISIGTSKAKNFSPFVALDHFETGKHGGFPDHPHRGQETVTYMLKGYMDHEDFTGSTGTVGPGDLQFMTAGRGIVHAEMPRVGDEGESPEGTQLWVDLPKDLKHCAPRYNELTSKEIPIAKPNDKVEVKVISGRAYDVENSADILHTPVWYFDYTVKPGGSVEQEIPIDHNSFLYLLGGSIILNGTEILNNNIVLFRKSGDGVKLSVSENAKEAARFLLISGKEHDQPIVQYGPFVETSDELIKKAFSDYETSQNGFEKARNWRSRIGNRRQL